MIYFLRNLFVPVVLHILIIAAYSTIDPCNGNPGCMAGSATAFFLILVSAPTILILLITTTFQAFETSPNYSKYLKINIGIALVPYLLVGILIIGVRAFN